MSVPPSRKTKRLRGQFKNVRYLRLEQGGDEDKQQADVKVYGQTSTLSISRVLPRRTAARTRKFSVWPSMGGVRLCASATSK